MTDQDNESSNTTTVKLSTNSLKSSDIFIETKIASLVYQSKTATLKNLKQQWKSKQKLDKFLTTWPSPLKYGATGHLL